MVENIASVSGQSMDIEGVNKEKLKRVFPECFVEGKLDIDKLLNLCGEYIDNDFEKYKFEWKGKSECYKIAGKRSTGTLRPCSEESVNFDTTKNIYIEGDNLEVLKLLQTSYYRKVKMIYIDPPYNTGNDFVYEDDFKDPLAKYKEVTQQTTKSNPETMGRFHTNWLNMMYPRLRLASNLLRDDGVIFISIDDNEVTNLRKLCDEVFGEENFVAQMVKIGNSAKNNVKQMSISHEYCIIYAKNLELLNAWKIVRTNANEYQKRAITLLNSGLSNEEIQKELRILTKYPKFYEFDHYTYCDSNGVFRANDLTAPNSKNYYDILHPGTHKPCKTGTRGWAYSQDAMNKLIKKNLIYFGEDENVIPQLKCYLDDTLLQSPRAVVFYDSQMDTKWIKANKLGFEFSKPIEFIKKLIEMCTNCDDIILDFFSGSATTAHAVMQLNAEDGGNRQFIMVQLPELCDEKSEAFKAGYKNICEIGKERIRRAGKKILEEQAHLKGFARINAGKDKPEMFTLFTNSEEGKELQNKVAQTLDVGFKVFKLDTSNLVKWDSTPTENKDEIYQRMSLLKETIKPERNDLDVVYEVMLKLGIPLNYPIQKVSVNDKRAYSIGEDCLVLVCLDYGKDGITADDVKLMCEDYTPAKIVASEQAFKDDVSLSNAHYILKDHNIEMKLL